MEHVVDMMGSPPLHLSADRRQGRLG